MMKRTTKLLLMMLVLVMSAGLVSCDDVTGSQDNPVVPTPTPTPAPTYASDEERPLTFEAAVDGVKVTLKFASGATPDYKKVEYSLDQGATWTALKRRNQAITLEKAGDMVMFRGDNPTYNGDARFVTELVNAKARGITRGYEIVGAYIYASGNTNSLLVMDGYSDKKELTEPFTFKELFKGSNINISDKEKLLLPATNNTVGCYQGMFADNAYLEVAPVLGAEKLVDKCYVGTFENDLRLRELTLGANSVEDGVMVKDCIDGILMNAGTELSADVVPKVRIEGGTNGELSMQNVTVAEANEIIRKEQEEADQIIQEIQNVISASEGGDPDGNLWDVVIIDENGVEHEIPPEAKAVENVTIDQKTLSLEIGATSTLIAIITPDNASIKSMTWTSENPKIATVTAGSDGKATVTAVAEGMTRIVLIVNDGEKTLAPQCMVTVTKPEPIPEPDPEEDDPEEEDPEEDDPEEEPEPEPEPENPVIDATDDFVDGGDPLK